MFSRFIGILILFISSSTLASIKVTNVKNASNFNLAYETGTSIVYGGISGSVASCTTENKMCNSCATPDRSCNKKRIHDNLELEVSFKVMANTRGEIHFGYYDDGGAPKILRKNIDYSVSTGKRLVKKNTIGKIKISWAKLCDLLEDVEGLTPGQGCIAVAEGGMGGGELQTFIMIGNTETSQHSVDLKVIVQEPDFDGANINGPDLYVDGAQAPDVGLESFDLMAGNGRLFIVNINPSLSCPDTNTGFVKKFRFYYSTTSFSDANYDSAKFKDFMIDENCSPMGSWVISGLTNGKYYHVRAAIVDDAENVAFLTDHSIYQGVYGCADTVSYEVEDANCRFAAKPSAK